MALPADRANHGMICTCEACVDEWSRTIAPYEDDNGPPGGWMTPAELVAIGRHLYGQKWEAQLAEVCSVTPATVRRWLTKDIKPKRANRIRALVQLRSA